MAVSAVLMVFDAACIGGAYGYGVLISQGLTSAV